MTTHEYYTKNKEMCSLKFKNWYNKNKHKELVSEWVTYLYLIYLKGYGE